MGKKPFPFKVCEQCCGGGGDGAQFIVTGDITYDSKNYSYKFSNMSATYEEIKNTIEQGKDVTLKLLNSIGKYMYANFAEIDSDGFLYFKSVDYYYSDYNGKLEHGYFDVWCEPNNIWGMSQYPFTPLAVFENYVEEVAPFIFTGNMSFNSQMWGYVLEDVSATYEQIKEAYDSGRDVIIKLTETTSYDTKYIYANLVAVESDKVMFRSFAHKGSSPAEFEATCYSDNDWYAGAYELMELIQYEKEIGSVKELKTANKETVVEAINELADQTGDIETALDSIIAIQNQLMGVSEE